VLSKIDICNLALNKMGAKSIRAFDEDNKLARQCELAYEAYRETLQTKYDWSFCTKYAQLSLLSETGTDTLEYVFALPSDCLRPREVRPFLPSVNWQRVGRKIFTNISEVYLIYSANITDVSQFPAYFGMALAGQIASQTAVSIVQDTKLLETIIGNTVKKGWVQEVLDDALEADGASQFDYKTYGGNAEHDTFVNP
jgi:hypothetical protein